MQNDAGKLIEITAKDIEAYWRGRAYIEAARMAHEAHDDKTANTITYKAIEPYLEQGREAIVVEREAHEGDLPDAVFEEGQTLEPRFVVLFALMLDNDKGQIGGKTIESMAHLSAHARDKQLVLVLNGHDTDLARSLALESGYEVRDSGMIALAEVSAKMMRSKNTGFFELDEPRVRKEPDPNLRAVRNKHNIAGRRMNNPRFNAKPARQNFKGRGR